MKQLSDTWFAEGYIDFELKKYTLLAYLQEINKYFNENKLYPQLGDVVFHYNNLVAFRENKKFLPLRSKKHCRPAFLSMSLSKIRSVFHRWVSFLWI